MRPRIWFQFVPERKEAKNRVHLDIDVTLRLSLPLAQRCERVDARVRDLVARWATVLKVSCAEGQCTCRGVL